MATRPPLPVQHLGTEPAHDDPAYPELAGSDLAGSALSVTLPGGHRTLVLDNTGSSSPAGARPTLVLLHGWMGTAALNWASTFTALGEGFHVVAPDLLGHGRFGAEAPRFSADACADDVTALVAQLGLGPVIAVGYSMGGAIAQVMARRHPEAVRGLVLCATAATFAEYTWLRPAVHLAGWAGGGIARHWPGPSQALLRRRLARRAANAATGGQDHPAWAVQDRQRAGLAGFIEAGAALNAYDSRPWLHEIDVPTAVVVTTEDRRVRPWRQDTLLALIPRAQRFDVPTGHDGLLAHPDVFLPVLRQACLAVMSLPGQPSAAETS